MAARPLPAARIDRRNTASRPAADALAGTLARSVRRRLLARVTYPHLKAVQGKYAKETEAFGHDFTEPVANVVAMLSHVEDTLRQSAAADVSVIPQIATRLGAPASQDRSAWQSLIGRWLALLNEHYFGDAPPSLDVAGHPRPPYPGPLKAGALPVTPANKLTKGYEIWLRWRLAAEPVARDVGAQQFKTEVSISSGRLHRAPPADGAPGVPVDTGASVTWFHGSGWEIFALSHDGHLHMSSHLVGKRHHSSLLNAKDVAAAGEMKVRDGTIVALTPKTGHYQAGPRQMLQVLHHLTKSGADLHGAALLAHDDKPIAKDAAAWWEQSGRTNYEQGKTKAAQAWYAGRYGDDAIAPALGGSDRDVRKALKQLFPTEHWQPVTTEGEKDLPAPLNIAPRPKPKPIAANGDTGAGAGIPWGLSSDYTVSELDLALRRAVGLRS